MPEQLSVESWVGQPGLTVKLAAEPGSEGSDATARGDVVKGRLEGVDEYGLMLRTQRSEGEKGIESLSFFPWAQVREVTVGEAPLPE